MDTSLRRSCRSCSSTDGRLLVARTLVTTEAHGQVWSSSPSRTDAVCSSTRRAICRREEVPNSTLFACAFGVLSTVWGFASLKWCESAERRFHIQATEYEME